jgi:GT2 family glycosyltransferase
MFNQVESELVSVIILNHNGKRFLESCLRSVLQSTYPNFEVILVDNGSSDDSVEFVTGKFGGIPRLKVVEISRNHGFAEGNNIGAKHAKGGFLVFLNNDTRTPSDWLSKLVSAVLADRRIGIAACRILSASDPEGLLIGNVDKFGTGVLVNMNEDRDCETIASGPAFLITRDCWLRVGGFDSKYFMYMEDIDLAWRVKLLGYKVVAVTSSSIYHHIGGTTKRTALERRRYFTYRNTLRTLLKNYSSESLFRTLPPSLFLISAQAFALTCFLKRPGITASLVRAILWNVVNFKDTWTLHAQVQRTRAIDDGDVRRLMAKSNPIAVLLDSRREPGIRASR